jgi:Tol biopolymer transport system component
MLLAILLAATGAAADYKIAFLATNNEPGIYVMNSNGRGVKRLTGDKLTVLTSDAWSPDGERIMFFAFRKGDEDLGERYNLPFHFPLYVMNADGASQRRLLDFPVRVDAAWSPDSKSILCISSHEDPNRNDPDVQKNQKPALSALYVVDLATRAVRRLTDLGRVYSASWSPTGRQIVLTFGSPQRDVFIMNADGRDQKKLTNRGAIYPTWSPDGHSIAFVARDGWCVITTHPSAEKCVKAPRTRSIAWAPDSKRLLINGASICEPDGANCFDPARGGPFVMTGGFSPDGHKIIYQTVEGPSVFRAQTAKIMTVNVDGSDIHTLNDHLGESTMFAVSPLMDH